MNYLLLPDFIAMMLLVTVLLLVRSKRNDGVIRMWAAGLLLILLECAARIVYGMHTTRAVHMTSHAVALDAYGLAGALFLMSSSRVLRRMPSKQTFLWINVLPHLALFTVYSFEVKLPWIYHALVLLGFAIGFGSSAWLRRSWRFYLAFTVVWTPLLICTRVQQYRSAIYLSLFFLYALSAIFFYYSLRNGSRGKIAVVAGFSMWALCFATHPWIATLHPQWAEFASQFWNMQKFVITVGLLLVMLEDQIYSNEWLALHDGLTGLPNRRLFEDRLQHALSHAERTGSRLALFNMDLDGFKQVNDTLGHDAGDVLLCLVAENLTKFLRRADTLARLGGDEFTLIALDLDGAKRDRGVTVPQVEGGSMKAPQVQRILLAMMQAVETPINLGEAHHGAVVQVSASVGVAIYPDDGREASKLKRLADERMYQQKAERSRQRGKKAQNTLSDLDLQRV